MSFAYCPDCGAQLSNLPHGSANCPHCGFPLQVVAPETTVMPNYQQSRVPVNLQMAVDVDRTGSLRRYAEGVPRTLEAILGHLNGKTAGLEVSLQSHGDLDCNEPHILLTDRGTPEQAIADARTIIFEGGGDPRETHLDAIEHLLDTVPWGADPTRSRGAFIAFLTDDTKPTRSGKTPEQLGYEFQRRKILLYLVCQRTPALHSLCTAAGGMMLEISNSPDTAQLLNIAEALSASIAASVGSGATVPVDVNNLPPAMTLAHNA
jgi:hypothetical protein